jgi:hypothetical protein
MKSSQICCALLVVTWLLAGCAGQTSAGSGPGEASTGQTPPSAVAAEAPSHACPEGTVWADDGGRCTPIKSASAVFGGFSGALGAPRRGYESGRPSKNTSALPSFPWPPPTPSERLNFTRSQILPASSAANPTLADVGNHIVRALENAGYSEYSFYAIPSGFAVIARLERVEEDGTPAPRKFRFLAPSAPEPFSITAYVSQMFFAPEGYYRQIVFAVTTDVIRPSGPAPTAAVAQSLLLGGADRLPPEFRGMPFTGDYEVSALIYEYRKGPEDRDVRTLTPGRLDAQTNLVRAGIYAPLVSARN